MGIFTNDSERGRAGAIQVICEGVGYGGCSEEIAG